MDQQELLELENLLRDKDSELEAAYSLIEDLEDKVRGAYQSQACREPLGGTADAVSEDHEVDPSSSGNATDSGSVASEDVDRDEYVLDLEKLCEILQGDAMATETRLEACDQENARLRVVVSHLEDRVRSISSTLPSLPVSPPAPPRRADERAAEIKNIEAALDRACEERLRLENRLSALESERDAERSNRERLEEEVRSLREAAGRSKEEAQALKDRLSSHARADRVSEADRRRDSPRGTAYDDAWKALDDGARSRLGRSASEHRLDRSRHQPRDLADVSLKIDVGRSAARRKSSLVVPEMGICSPEHLVQWCEDAADIEALCVQQRDGCNGELRRRHSAPARDDLGNGWEARGDHVVPTSEQDRKEDQHPVFRRRWEPGTDRGAHRFHRGKVLRRAMERLHRRREERERHQDRCKTGATNKVKGAVVATRMVRVEPRRTTSASDQLETSSPLRRRAIPLPCAAEGL